MWWMLAIAAFPGVQFQAQVELDAVIGHARIPNMLTLHDSLTCEKSLEKFFAAQSPARATPRGGGIRLVRGHVHSKRRDMHDQNI